MFPYLEHSTYIDWHHPLIMDRAQTLSAHLFSEEAIAKSCFEFVRDEIKHSGDHRQNPVTCKASDVLMHGTGYCYAKSHLLAALLRANNIPAGLCYQRLTITDEPPFALHGLNAIHLKKHGWYRVDARGNKAGVQADFCPPTEALAFPILRPEECDFSQIWHEPHPAIIDALTTYDTVQQVIGHLPDDEGLCK